MSDAPRSLAVAAWVGVGAAWVFTLLFYGVEADLSRDDLCYLTTLHDFQLGYESRKNYSHLGWGLLHLLGHLDLWPSAWRAGRVGAVLALVATTIVPFAAWVAYRLTDSLLRDRRAALMAAALMAWSPAVLLGASTLGFWSRAGAVGLALLGLAKLLDAMDPVDGRRRDAFAAVALQGAGMAIHPWAITVPALALPLLIWRVAQRRSSPVTKTVLGVLFAQGLVCIAFLAGGQEHRVSAASANLIDALAFMPLVAAAHGAWQVPFVGMFLPGIEGGIPAHLFLVAILGLLAVRRTREVGLLCAGALLCTLPEATAPYPPTQWFQAWTGNFIKAAVGMEFVAIVAVARLLTLGTPPVRARTAVFALTALLIICAARAAVPVGDTAALGRGGAAAGRTLGKALAGAASLQTTLKVEEGLEPLNKAGYRGKFNSEIDVVGSRAGRMKKGRKKKGPHAGADFALWRTSAMRCELRLGLSVADGIVPADPTRRHHSLCQRPPVILDAGERHPCALSFEVDMVRFACPIGPPHAGARDSLDPASVPVGIAGALVLLLALGVSRRRLGEVAPQTPPSMPPSASSASQ
ncbi:MAG: hypothetical protein KDA24_18325 [Deltaproteobacteria bacterium]|nr:hypothetical protein [Deltaproteobacteria bacterium]